MSLSLKPLLFRLCIAALHCASWMVDEEERYEWLREWASELWHIRKVLEEAPLREQLQMLTFARGSFPDAFSLAIHNRRTRQWRLPVFHSPVQCLMVLLLMSMAATTA